MARYLTQVSYTSEAMSHLISNPQDRGAVIRELFQRLGGKVETFDYCFGDYHLVLIVEFPDNESVEAIMMAAYASGAIKDLKITVLMPMEEAVRAMTRAHAAGYKPPSG